jgi:hypothetical protein
LALPPVVVDAELGFAAAFALELARRKKMSLMTALAAEALALEGARLKHEREVQPRTAAPALKSCDAAMICIGLRF